MAPTGVATMVETNGYRLLNVRIIDPARGVDEIGELAISGARIVEPGALENAREIDASGLIACPGLIDLGARMGEPGFEQKATIESESRAAAAGGITTACYPPDCDPVMDSAAVVELVRARARRTHRIRLLPLGAMSADLKGEQLSEMHSLKHAGCVGVSNARAPLAGLRILRHAMEYATTYGLTVFLHPVEHSLSGDGCAHEGLIATRLGLAPIPAEAESIAVASGIELARLTGARVHFCRISSAASIPLLRAGINERLPVSADVAIANLILSDRDLLDFDSNCHVQPPLRGVEDRRALREAVASGIIGSICSDHTPHEPDAKAAPFGETQPGMIGLQTLLPLALQVQREDKVPLIRILDALTAGPARALGRNPPSLEPGTRADLCVFDPGQAWRFDIASSRSAAANSPFMGWELEGLVRFTFFDGQLVFESQAGS